MRDVRFALLDDAYAVARNNEVMTGKFHRVGGFVSELPGEGAIGRDLKLLKTEENYAGDFVGNLWGYKQTGRVNTLFLNVRRDHIFDIVDKGWQRAEDATRVPTRVNNFAETGVAPPTLGQRISGALARPGDREALATYITRNTGRGTLGPLEGTWVDDVLGVGFFSPRFQLSKLQGPLQMFNWKHPRVAIEAIKDYSASFAATVSLLALANESGLAEVELDPTSSRFGQFSVGKGTTIDPWAGFRPLAVLTARMISGHYEGGYPAPDMTLLSDFIRGKLSPLVSAGVNLTGYWPGAEQGKDAIGKPFGMEELGLSFMPMFASRVYAAAQEGLMGEALITLPLEIIGLGVNTYLPSTGKRTEELYDEVAPQVMDSLPGGLGESLKGLTYKDLTTVERDAVDAILAKDNPELINRLHQERAASDSIFNQARQAEQKAVEVLKPKLDEIEAGLYSGDRDHVKAILESADDLYNQIRGASIPIRNSDEYKKAVAGFKQDDLDALLNTWYDLPSAATTAGQVDWDLVESLQGDLIEVALDTDPQLAERLVFNISQEKQAQHPVLQLVRDVSSVSQEYYELPAGVQRNLYFAQNPDVNVMRWFLGYNSLYSGEALAQAQELAPERTDIN